MKSRKIIATLLCLFAFASASFAASNPLNDPTALALDANGNLWVANQGSNSILEFNSSYELQTKRTITQDIDTPTGLAFDPTGNLWVVNSASNSVNEYTKGVENTAATISLTNPQGIAIDGLGNLWVSSQFNAVSVYIGQLPYAPPGFLLFTLSTPALKVYSIAISGGSLAWGALDGAGLFAAEGLLNGNVSSIAIPGSKTTLAMAAAADGVLFMANFDGTVDVYTPATNTTKQFLKLNSVPPGMAVDNVRGRVYLALGAQNAIAVYSKSGALLTTIQ